MQSIGRSAAARPNPRQNASLSGCSMVAGLAEGLGGLGRHVAASQIASRGDALPAWGETGLDEFALMPV